MDSKRLDFIIQEKGFKYEYLAGALGISNETFRRKRKGITEFKLSEILKLCDILGINSEELKSSIFFN